MNEPTSIYWRRRMVAVGGVVAAMVILGWAAGGFFGEGAAPVQSASGDVRDSQPPSTPPNSPPSSSSSSTAPPSSATASEPPAPPPPPPPPPDPNLPCPDVSTQIVMELGAPQYKVGQRPVLRIVIANAGPVPCTRDISRALREVIVTSPDGVNRIWSSNDCYHYSQPDLRIMQAGDRFPFEVKWAGRTSAPGCPTKRTTVQAGTYAVTGKLGALTSPPVPIVLV